MADEQPPGLPPTERVELAELDTWIDGGTLSCSGGAADGSGVDVKSAPVLVGRAEGCDLVIPDARISATHLELVPTERGVVARDLGTTNGTWLGPVRVQEIILADGTELTVGDSTLRFSYADAPARVQRKQDGRFHGMVGRSPAMRAVYATLERLATTQLNVLIEGETGTGKELAARALHAASERAKGPFVVVDCGALPATLVESTLFGHEKGAFSGAQAKNVGLIEAANGGTVFLDEIGELPLEMQTRLLRAIEARTIRRVGASREISVDVRYVSATHRDLPSRVAASEFRSDLFFRIATARVKMPALRDRPGDVQVLADAILRDLDDPPPQLSPAAQEALSRRDFPGNVRELRNVLEVAAAFAESGVIDVKHLPSHLDIPPAMGDAAPPRASTSSLEDGELPLYREGKEAAIEDFDREYFSRLLDETDGNITRAAARAGIERHHLRALLKKRGLR